MPTAERRQVRVYARHVDRHHAHVLREASFEAAAIAYLENWPHAPDEDPEVEVVVRELATGHEHCFWVGLHWATTAPCE
jgi:hypothetical protein